VALYDAVAGLPVEVDDYILERHEVPVSSGFTRVSTVIVLRGGGVEGRGEDVTYQPEPHDEFLTAAPLDVRFRGSFDELSARLAAFDGGYRRWGAESAALDLSLRQAGRSLGDVVGRPYRPVRFVVSTRLDARHWLAIDPELELKLDPEPAWTDDYIAAVAATGRVRCLDLKAYYTATAVDNPPDPRLYRACVERFDASTTIEDASLEGELREIFRGVEERLSFDAPIHSVADIEALPVEPRRLNIKPSRFDTVRELLAAIDWCEARGIELYGGGQFELADGRRHVQALASLFYPDGANDVAPPDYNAPEPRPGLPRSPLPAPVVTAGIV
jgi:hypothetical protein